MQIDKFKVEEWFNKYEKDAVYDLADTCVSSLSCEELFKITECDEKEVFKRILNYGDIHGSTRLKNAISTLYENQSCENITITHGTIGANHLVFLSLIEPDDKVVAIIPNYQQHYSIPKSFGANVEYLYLKEKNNWLPDLEELEKLAQGAKIITLSNPNNPTGAVISDSMMEKIVKIARKNSAYILCDEVYRGLNHNGNSFSKSVADLYEKGISTSGVSKVFSLAGLRLGWIVSNKELITKINSQREYNTISVGIINDYLASIAIENKSKIIERNLKKIKEGKEILLSWAKSEPQIRLVSPCGGTTALLGYNFDFPSADLCKNLQEKTGVMILPGSTLEMEGYLRVGYGNNPEKLKKGLEIFSNYLKNKS